MPQGTHRRIANRESDSRLQRICLPCPRLSDGFRNHRFGDKGVQTGSGFSDSESAIVLKRSRADAAVVISVQRYRQAV